MKKETITALLVLVIAGIVLSANAFADSTIINATVTIPATCGIATTAGTVNFGSVNAGATSTEQNLIVNNTGSTEANVTILGTAWVYSSYSMPVGQTKFAVSTGTYASKTALTAVDQSLALNVANGGNTPLYLQMAVPYGQHAGVYDQNITVTTTC